MKAGVVGEGYRTAAVLDGHGQEDDWAGQCRGNKRK
jgi:hypothetical protein